MNNIWIIAQAASGDAPQTISSEPMNAEGQTTSISQTDANNGTQQKNNKGNSSSMLILAVMMVVMMFILFRTPQKQKQQQKKLEQSLEKNDRVLTIGGIYGTIIDIKEDEVTLKVDESNNTKIKIVRKAISRNLTKD
jgi:preprotein translocase subunit YajC